MYVLTGTGLNSTMFTAAWTNSTSTMTLTLQIHGLKVGSKVIINFNLASQLKFIGTNIVMYTNDIRNKYTVTSFRCPVDETSFDVSTASLITSSTLTYVPAPLINKTQITFRYIWVYT
jgi:hypothetical protein